MWKCPKCGSQSLKVWVETCADLIQNGDEFETEAENDHDWDGRSTMICKSCGHCEAARKFQRENENV